MGIEEPIDQERCKDNNRGVDFLMTRKCPLCGKAVFRKHFTYCPTCSLFVYRLQNTHLSIQAKQSVLDYVHKHGYVCYYTGMSLNLKDPKDPWYCVFDHWIPGDDRRIVLTSFLVNDMKTDLSEDEFWYTIEQLYNFKKYGSKIRKIRLKYWQGFYRDPEYGPGMMTTLKKKCCICGKLFVVGANNEKYFPICAEVLSRMRIKKFPASTIKEVLDYIGKNGYVCYYTGMSLVTRNARSPWYVVLDHWIPGNPKKVVLTSALFNCMKTDLTENEFWCFIEQLYNHRKKHTQVKKKRPVYWYRLGATCNQAL